MPKSTQNEETIEEVQPVVEEKPVVDDTNVVDQMAANMSAILDAIQSQRQELEVIKQAIDEEKKSRQELSEQVNYIADKGRLFNWEDKLNKANEKVLMYFLREYNGKVVTGWSALKTNMVYKNEQKQWIENQLTDLFFADGTKEENVPLRLWENERKRVEAMYDGETLTKDGGRILKLVTKDGTHYEIDVKFVN